MVATITMPRLLLLPILQNSRHLIQNGLSFYSRNLVRHASSVTAATAPAGNEDESLPADRRVDFDADSLAARGYLRNQKPYSPPANVEAKILQLCEKYMGKQTSFQDPSSKFQVLCQCSQSLQHAVPNSFIHKITNIEELMAFYKTPINTTVPLDMMKDMDLPKNLHVIYKYERFHPETDTMFGGVTAFTKDSNIVTGLKNRKKYPSFINKSTWPFK